MSDELIVNLAPTGMIPTRAATRHVPLTPTEVANDVRRCSDAGASIVHVHPRDDSGRPSQDPEVAAAFIRAIRGVVPDIVICITTSGRVNPELDGRVGLLRLEGDARPEMASLTLGSNNFPQQASINAPATIQGLATAMLRRAIVAEWEVFDFGMLDYGLYLRTKGLLPDPVYVNFLLGSLGTASATAVNLALLVDRLPVGAVWAATGIGRFQRRVNQLAIASGGHVRIGLEDNIWFDDDRTELATNLKLVERVVRVARSMGREPASPAQVRQLLAIPDRVAQEAASAAKVTAFGEPTY